MKYYFAQFLQFVSDYQSIDGFLTTYHSLLIIDIDGSCIDSLFQRSYGHHYFFATPISVVSTVVERVNTTSVHI